MQSKAATVEQYLEELPEDRRASLQAVRKVILRNLDKTFEEGMSYGMIGYYVPHRVYPAGYHCDPTKPLPFAGLASQKNHMSLYIMSLYDPEATDCPDEQRNELLDWFRKEWAKTGKKLDMGKACIRFKTLDDLPLEVVGEAIRRTPAKRYIAHYEASREAALTKKAPVKKASRSKVAKKSAGRPTVKKTARAKSGR